jgi:hypothetical protein
MGRGIGRRGAQNRHQHPLRVVSARLLPISKAPSNIALFRGRVDRSGEIMEAMKQRM